MLMFETICWGVSADETRGAANAMAEMTRVRRETILKISMSEESAVQDWDPIICCVG